MSYPRINSSSLSLSPFSSLLAAAIISRGVFRCGLMRWQLSSSHTKCPVSYQQTFFSLLHFPTG